MKELRLSEELLLFAIDEKKGVVPLIKASLIKLGLAGAVLYELEDRGKLELDGDRVKVLDEDPTGDSILDKSLKKISASKKKKKVAHWLPKIGKKSLKVSITQELLTKGMLRKIDDDEPGWSFRRGGRYRPWFDTPLKHTEQKLREILLHHRQPGEKNLKLIGLLHACRLYSLVFEQREEYREAKEKARRLSEDDRIRKGIRSAVNNKRGQVASSLLSGVFAIIKEAC
ncbi:MAG: GPP34 family phosphoprotein [Candidatus Aminicenantes bacterium]|nr:GPP34 family phosphoprotein [Candidatus Aminicenantes bacterium]